MSQPTPSHLALSLVALLLAGSPAQGEVTITGTATEPFWDVQNCEDCAPDIDRLTIIDGHPLAFFSGDPAVDVPRPGLICHRFGHIAPRRSSRLHPRQSVNNFGLRRHGKSQTQHPAQTTLCIIAKSFAFALSPRAYNAL